MARTVAQAEALAEKLRALPAIENKNRPISKAEEIKLLAGEIAALQERNYSLQQIAATVGLTVDQVLAQAHVMSASDIQVGALLDLRVPAKGIRD